LSVAANRARRFPEFLQPQLAADDERVRRAVAEPLAAQRCQRKDRTHQIEEEAIDQTQQVAKDCFTVNPWRRASS
jgi:hypothetical protein